jgi:hypothetical protein
MATVHDLMSAPEFADDQLTIAINIPPYQSGILARLGLFADTPIATTYAKIGIKDGELTIIPSRERGGPSNKNMGSKRGEVLVNVPHFPLDDAITPSDVQNLLVYGEDRVFESFGNVLNGKLIEIRGKHDATWAHMDWGALNGLVLDADGYEILDIYERFGVTQETISLALGTAGTDVAEKTRDVKARVRKELKGSPMSGMHILAGPEWFAAYTAHASVRDAYKFFANQGPNPNRDGLEDGFFHAGSVIERVDEEFTVRLENGTLETRPAIEPDEALAVPLGTSFFKRFISPPDTIADANTAPNPTDKVFISTAERDHGKGYDIHSESNVLPANLRPQAVKRLTL